MSYNDIDSIKSDSLSSLKKLINLDLSKWNQGDQKGRVQRSSPTPKFETQ
jgi:hypothetical protein